MSNPTFKPGDRVYCEDFGKGIIRAIRTNDALVEFTNKGIRQVSVKFEDLVKPNANDKAKANT